METIINLNPPRNKEWSLSDKKRDTILLVVIGLVALGIRFFLMVYFQSYIIRDDWAFGYEAGRIAKSIAVGDGFSSPFRDPTGPTVWLVPAYPLLLASIFTLFGVYTAHAAIVALVINCLTSALSCVPIFFIGKKLFNRTVGYIAAATFAIYPPSIWHAINTIWDTTIFVFLVSILMAWLFSLPETLNFKNASYFGLFMGLVALMNAVILIFYPFVILWLYFKSRRRVREKVLCLGTTCLLTAIVLSPWLLRNYWVFGRLMLRSNFGLELKLGNNAFTGKSLDMPREERVSLDQAWKLQHPSNAESEFRRYSEMGEIDYMQQCYDEASTFIRENPWTFARLTFKRFSNFWLSDLGVSNPWKGNLKVSGRITLFKVVCYLVPLPFMLLGILFAVRRRRMVAPLLAFLVLIPAVYYITHVSQRYRFTIEPLILILGSYGFYSLMVRNKDST
jgi:4-amino-4-deoxy-L-arabinose transferase-like glycosyltransferase